MIESETVGECMMSSGWLDLGMRKLLFRGATVNSDLCKRVKKWEITMNMIKDIINILLVFYVCKTIYSHKYSNILENKMVYVKILVKKVK